MEDGLRVPGGKRGVSRWWTQPWVGWAVGALAAMVLIVAGAFLALRTDLFSVLDAARSAGRGH
jgi:hypothetical protein